MPQSDIFNLLRSYFFEVFSISNIILFFSTFLCVEFIPPGHVEKLLQILRCTVLYIYHGWYWLEHIFSLYLLTHKILSHIFTPFPSILFTFISSVLSLPHPFSCILLQAPWLTPLEWHLLTWQVKPYSSQQCTTVLCMLNLLCF